MQSPQKPTSRRRGVVGAADGHPTNYWKHNT